MYQSQRLFSSPDKTRRIEVVILPLPSSHIPQLLIHHPSIMFKSLQTILKAFFAFLAWFKRVRLTLAKLPKRGLRFLLRVFTKLPCSRFAGRKEDAMDPDNPEDTHEGNAAIGSSSEIKSGNGVPNSTSPTIPAVALASTVEPMACSSRVSNQIELAPDLERGKCEDMVENQGIMMESRLTHITPLALERSRINRSSTV